MTLDLVIGFQRNEGVLSLAKALLVYIRLRGGPQACCGILPQWLKLGVRLLGFRPAKSQCSDGGVGGHLYW